MCLFQIRLVNHSVPQNENGNAAFERALKLAQEILPNGPVGVKMGKIAINKGMDVSIITIEKYKALYFSMIITRSSLAHNSIFSYHIFKLIYLDT